MNNELLTYFARRLENDLAEVKEENRLCSERLVGLEDLRQRIQRTVCPWSLVLYDKATLYRSMKYDW